MSVKPRTLERGVYVPDVKAYVTMSILLNRFKEKNLIGDFCHHKHRTSRVLKFADHDPALNFTFKVCMAKLEIERKSKFENLVVVRNILEATGVKVEEG